LISASSGVTAAFTAAAWAAVDFTFSAATARATSRVQLAGIGSGF
jgi:hypothetical protein